MKCRIVFEEMENCVDDDDDDDENERVGSWAYIYHLWWQRTRGRRRLQTLKIGLILGMSP